MSILCTRVNIHACNFWPCELDYRRVKVQDVHYLLFCFQPTYTFDPAYKNPCWRENGTLRCLPYFFLIGVKKCGTTELYKLIEKHPDYITPDGNKEPGWFAEGRFDKNR